MCCRYQIVSAILCTIVYAAIVKQAGFVPSNFFAQLVKDNGRVIFTGTLICTIYVGDVSTHCLVV